MGYIAIHTLRFPVTQQPTTVGKPTPIPSNTMGDIRPKPFLKLAAHNVPVTKLIIRRQVNT